jgi:uroporphyrinogen-III synthase
MRVIVTRPEEDAGPLRQTLEALGHSVILQPLMTIAPRRDVTIPNLPWQAVVATSANGIRALPDASSLHHLPMLTVGPQSLKAAQDAGFTLAEAHGGDVDGLAAHVIAARRASNGPILYLSGAETAGNLQGQLAAAGFDCRRVVLYDAVPARDLGEAAIALRQHKADAVLLYSPRSARIWSSLAKAAGLSAEAAAVPSLCLSRNVAAALPEGCNALVAEKPENAAMLRLLEELHRTR